MQSNFKKAPFFILIILLALLTLAFLFLYREVNSNNQKAKDSTTELQNEISRREDIRSLNLSIDAIKEDKTKLETHFAKSSDIVPFLNTMEGLALKVGATAEVTSVNILNDNTGLMVHINASGNFDSLYKFLMLLENSPYELEFTGVDMQREATGDVSEGNVEGIKPKWQAAFEIKLLSFVP